LRRRSLSVVADGLVPGSNSTTKEVSVTTQPAHEQLRSHPFWQVQTVFDPDGGGKEFAYTIGLHSRGLPELHIWGRPSLGDDPGDDWMLSMNDRTRVLNELAWLLIDGKLDVGANLRRECDAGLAVVHYRVDPPGDRDELEAFGIAPGAIVLPIPWSLTRPPEGKISALSADACVIAEADYESVLATVDRHVPAPLGWELPDWPSWSPDQRFGPRTPVVLARAAQLSTRLSLLTGSTPLPIPGRWPAPADARLDGVRSLTRFRMLRGS
jgi:hypothetical protein